MDSFRKPLPAMYNTSMDMMEENVDMENLKMDEFTV